jgi:inosine-uridine nucleoside N-ribohydrolase
MKTLVLALALALATMPVLATQETREVCVDVKDKQGQPVKDAKGKVKQRCQTVKVHQKLEGTKVPEKK